MSSRPSLPPPPTVDFRRQTPIFVGRSLLAAAVLGIAYWTATRVDALWIEREPTAMTNPDVPPASRVAPADSAEGLMATMLAGRWEFVEGGWMLGVGSTTDAGASAFLARPATAVDVTGAVGDWERTVLDLAKSFKLIGASLGARRIYRFDSPTLRAEIIASEGAATERLLTARAVFQTAPGQWSTMETERVPELVSRHAPASLLPYPERSELLAVRRDAADHVVGEFLRCESKIAPLLAHWRDAGSPVALTSAFDASEFSEGFCERHGRMLRLILWEPRSQGVTTILVLDASPSEARHSNSARTLVP